MTPAADYPEITLGNKNVNVCQRIQTTGSEIQIKAACSTTWGTAGKTKCHKGKVDEERLAWKLWEQKKRKLGATRGKYCRNQKVNRYSKLHILAAYIRCTQRILNLLKANIHTSFRKQTIHNILLLPWLLMLLLSSRF